MTLVIDARGLRPAETTGRTDPIMIPMLLAVLLLSAPGAAAPPATDVQQTDAQQIAYLSTVDKTPFFLAVRRLTVLGLTALPKYGGNRDGLGWKLIGFVDGHYWEPPFGYYDKDYAGFEPFPGTKPYTA